MKVARLTEIRGTALTAQGASGQWWPREWWAKTAPGALSSRFCDVRSGDVGRWAVVLFFMGLESSEVCWSFSLSFLLSFDKMHPDLKTDGWIEIHPAISPYCVVSTIVV